MCGKISKNHKKIMAALLSFVIVLSTVFTGLGDSVVVWAASGELVDGTTVSTAEEGTSYYYDFINNESLASAAAGQYGLLTVSDGVAPNSHGQNHSNGTSLTIKVAGDSKISIGYCAYDSEGTKYSVTSETGTIGELPVFPAKQSYSCYSQSGRMYSFDYIDQNEGTGELTIHFEGTYYVPYILVEPLTEEEGPEANTTYTYDFTATAANTVVPTSYDSANPIKVLQSDDGLLTIYGDGTMYHHGDSHGLVVKEKQAFDVKVAGNAYITFKLCGYSKSGTIDVSYNEEDGKVSKSSISLVGTTDGEEATFAYSGEATTLTFNINGSGYLHGITVENTNEEVNLTEWVQKDFSFKIGNETVTVAGSTLETEAATVTASNGNVYYSTGTNAYITLPLNAETIKESQIENLSSDVVESYSILDGTTIVATMKDQTTYPFTYTIKVQDTDAFVVPDVTDIYSFDFTSGVIPKAFTSTNRIEDYYTTDNGILSLGTGEGTKHPYWHDASHGIAVNNGNYVDVKVAGDATITFSLCMYGAGGTLTASNLSDGGEGNFSSDSLKGESCGDTITYSYTGKATTLRFTVASTGEAYLHSVSVKNTGTKEESEVANIQTEMPYIAGAEDFFAVHPYGHRLAVSQTDTAASISTMKNISYYLFAPTTDAATIEADIKINAIGGSSSYGVFVGMFDPQEPISKIATLGVRGDSKVRNVYTKAGAANPSAGSTDLVYSADDTLHIVVTRTADGLVTSVTAAGETTTATIKYSATELLSGIDTLVSYGIAFSNVEAVIKNLTYTSSTGEVLYSQNDCYEAIGTAPVVNKVYDPEVSSDRTTITASWSGNVCSEDAAYMVELSKDNGKTFEILSNDVTLKTYTATIDGSGEYLFRISGICGSQTSEAVTSKAVTIKSPLDSTTIKAESGDSYIDLSWTAVNEATSYEIYRKSSEETVYTMIATVSETTYKDANLSNETPYYYYIIARSDDNYSNPSESVLSVPSAGHSGEYVYEDEAAELFITKKSYDTVYTNQATIEGIVDKTGTLALSVNGETKETSAINAKGTFSFTATLNEGRNDVTLYFTDENNAVIRKTFNFVYLTNYDIVVDQSFTGTDGSSYNGSDSIKGFSTVQAAVDSVASDNTSRVVILIKAGSYREHLVITSPYISLIGEDSEMVSLNFYDKEESPAGGDTSLRCATYVKSSATGFTAENLTFENTYEYLGDGTISNESADAIRVDADNSIFVNVRFKGYQDTLYASSNKQYYYKCYITGNVDFIYGAAQAVFNDCDIEFRYNGNKNSGYVTAPKTSATASYGYIFNNCRITAAEGCSGSKYLLARPWGADAAATFVNCYMSSIINKTLPYSDMSGNLYTEARFFEYYTYGGGFAINSNRPQISKAQAEELLTTKALGWDPYTVCDNTSYEGTITTVTDEQFVEKEYVETTADGSLTDDTGLSAYSISGYASTQNVTGGGLLLETASSYYKVASAEEFLSALSNIKKTGKASVIELTADINLGSIEIGDSINNYSDIIKAHTYQALQHPTLKETGVSMLSLKDMSNITIFSQNGASIKHVCIDVNNSKNIIIKNIVFDELWEWDEGDGQSYEAGEYDRNDWDYITIQNGSTGIWIDHCTFYKSYDGIVDVKKAVSDYTTDVTISWSQFLPESEGSFFDDMMSLLEENPENYPYYNSLLTHYGMTKEQIRAYASGQKKTHLIGASDTEENIENLQITLANNYYKDCMDRMPRLRGGNGHIYNCIMDSDNIYAAKMSITNSEAASKLVSNGALSTCNAHVLLENSYVTGIIDAALSGNMASPAGYINALNCAYYLNGVKGTLTPSGNRYTGENPLLLDVDEFKASLPYSNVTYYDAEDLSTKVLPYAGAGKVTMTVTQWEKTTYNNISTPEEDVEPSPAPTASAAPSTEPTATPTAAPSTAPTSTPSTAPTATPAATVSSVSGLKVKSATAKTATISWNKQSGVNGFVVTYTNAAGKSITKTLNSTTTSVKLSGFAPSKSYKVSVKAYKTVNGKKVYSSIKTVTVKTKSLGSVKVSGKKVTDSSIKLTFGKVTEASGYVVTYKNALGKKVTVTLKSTKTYVTIQKLLPNKKYSISIRPYTIINSKRVYGTAKTVSVKTSKASSPAKVSKLKVTKASKTSIKVKFSSVSGADGYVVYYSTKKNSGYKKVAVKASTSTTLKGLKSSKTYYVKVRSYKVVYAVSNGKLVTKRIYSNYSTVKKITVK